jgi:hypothetical protein
MNTGCSTEPVTAFLPFRQAELPLAGGHLLTGLQTGWVPTIGRLILTGPQAGWVSFIGWNILTGSLT